MITSQQFRDMEMRLNKSKPQPVPANATNDEGELQDQIISYCRQNGWFVDYSRMDLSTTRPKGAPDLYCFLPNKLLVIECKTRLGKQTVEQRGVQMMLEKAGHGYHLIRSFEEFLELVK